MRETELVWPPPDEDVDAFTVVHLDDGDALSSKPDVAPRPIKPTFGDCRAPGVGPRIRPLVVPATPPPLPPQPAESLAAPNATEHPPGIAIEEPPAVLASPVPASPVPASPVSVSPVAVSPVSVSPVSVSVAAADPEVTTAGRSAWLAVLFAAACAILAVFEYRIIVQERAEAGLAVAEPPPVPQGVTAAELAPSVPRVAQSSPVPPSRVLVARAEAPAVRALPALPAPSRAPRPSAVQAPTARPISTPASKPKAPGGSTPAAAALAAPPAPSVASTSAPRPAPAPRLAPASTPAPATAAAPAPAPTFAPALASVSVPPPATPMRARALDTPSVRPSVAVTTAAIASDEVDIRSTLTRFRTAYSQLDARAARDVWPSVDARALERAFQSLKSQDLRFDRCNLTVNGARAQASCTGRATYVPRIGDQSPRFTAREWAFELKKADEGWTIASARTL